MAIELAQAYVSLVPSMRGSERKIAKELGAVGDTAGREGGRSLGDSLAKWGKRGAVAAGAAIATVTGTALVKGFGRLQAIENAQAKMRGLGHDADGVRAIMDNALASVKGTAFGLGEAATTAAGAVAAGIKPGTQLEGVLKTVANSAAAAGVGMDEMGAIFNKAASMGKAQNDVLQQVADRGIPIYQALGEQFGKTTEEVFKMASEGKISFEDFTEAMTSAAGTVAEEMGGTFTGSFQNMLAALGRVGANLLSGVFPYFAEFFQGVTGLLGPIEEYAQIAGDALGRWLTAGLEKGRAVVQLLTGEFTPAIREATGWEEDAPIVRGILGLRDHIGAVATLLRGDFTSSVREATGWEEDSPIVTGLLEVQGGVRAMITAFQDGGREITSSGIAGAIEGIGVGARYVVDEVTGGVQAMVGAFRDGEAEITSTGLAGVLETIGVVARQVWDALGDTAREVGPQLLTLVAALSPLGIIFRALEPVLPQVATALGQIATAIGGALLAVLPPVVGAAVELSSALAEGLSVVIPALLPIVGQLATAVAQMLPALVPIIPAVVGLATGLVQLVAPLLSNEKVLWALIGAFAAWKAATLGIALGGLITSVYRSVAAFTASTIAKGKDLAATAALRAMILGDMVRALGAQIVSLARSAAAWAASSAAALGHRAAMVASTVATHALAAAQRVLNLVLRANPIGIIVTLLAGLVAGLVYAWNNSETFRDIVTGVWEAVWGAIQSAWEWISGVFDAIGDGLSAVGDWFGALPGKASEAWGAVTGAISSAKDSILGVFDNIGQGIDNVRGWFSDRGQQISNAWSSMKDRLSETASSIKTGVFNGIQTGINAVRDVFNNDSTAIGQAWGWLKDRLAAIWRGIDTTIFAPIKAAIGLVRAVFSGDTDRMKVAWQQLKDRLLTVWQNISNVVFQPLKNGIAAVQSFFSEKVAGVRRAFSDTYHNLSDTFGRIKNAVFQPFKDALGNLEGWVRSTKNTLKDIWDSVANVFRKPINWVIKTVWNDGIAKVFNSAASAVGSSRRLDRAVEIPAFAEGGRHRGGWALVGEEGPELVNFSNPGRIYTAAETAKALAHGRDLSEDQARRAAGSRPSEAVVPMGGPNIFQRAVSAVGTGVRRAVGAAVDWVRGGLADAAAAVLNPIVSAIGNTVGQWGTFGNLAGDTASRMVVDLTDWIRGKDAEAATTDAGGAPGPLTPGGWRRPSAGPITSRFGPRWGGFHAGIDIAGGGRTFAARAGTVAATGWNVLSGRTGIGILLNHGGGHQTYYGHNPVNGVVVRPGQQVRAGQHIGAQGATGNVTGIHLHFEHLVNGRPVNPQGLGVFDRGGVIPPGRSVIENRTGKLEYLANVTDAVNRGGVAGGGGVHVTQHIQAPDPLLAARKSAERVSDEVRKMSAQGVLV